MSAHMFFCVCAFVAPAASPFQPPLQCWGRSVHDHACNIVEGGGGEGRMQPLRFQFPSTVESLVFWHSSHVFGKQSLAILAALCVNSVAFTIPICCACFLCSATRFEIEHLLRLFGVRCVVTSLSALACGCVCLACRPPASSSCVSSLCSKCRNIV